jgi:head-tail adaptor
MRRQGVTVFLLFFGIATLDALNDGRWPRIVFWLAMGVGFALLDLWGSRRGRSSRPWGGDDMSGKRHFSTAEAREIGTRLGVDWRQVDLDQLRRGLEVELEHGAHDPQTNVTSDVLDLTGKIAWAHLKEIRDYYTRLDAMEADAEREKATIRLWSPGQRRNY